MLIKDVLEMTKKTDFIYALSVFLDEFKKSAHKEMLILAEPANITGYDKERSILAAVAHKLANENNIKVPDWVFKVEYILKQPYFQFDTKNKEYQEYLIQKSPIEFRQRNIYVDENALMRV